MWWIFLVESIEIVKCFIENTITYIHLLWFIFSKTHTGTGHEYKIFLFGRIDYSLVPYKNSKGIHTEKLTHIMMKVRRSFEHLLNVYMLIC